MAKFDNMNSNEDSTAPLRAQFIEALNSGQVNSVLEFLADLPSELPTSDLVRLVNADIDFRKSKGEEVEITDYIEDLPELASVVNEQTITRPQIHETTAALTEIEETPTDNPSKTRKLVQAGDTVDDFELLAELGRGSFATVFLARQNSMQRLVALKVSVDHGMEAQTLAQLDHPHIVRVFDQRRAHEHNLQLLYMQYLEGGTLLDVLKKVKRKPVEGLSGKDFIQAVDDAIIERGASPNYECNARSSYLESDWPQTICRIGYNLAKALEYAHDKGVLHRDIKPANVLIGSDYSVKLADFNISAAETVIGDAKFGGSLAYMSPEQIRAFNQDDDFSPEQLDHQCDVYSLGVMLYQLLTKELPFFAMTKSRSTDGLSTMIAEREQSIDRVKSSLRRQSPLIKKALIRCLQPDKNNRPESARDLANQLKVGLDRDAENFLFPAKRNWTIAFQRFFYAVCIIVNLIFNGLAAAFVFNFNLLDTVPESAHATFWSIQAFVNGTVFPLAIATFVYITISVPRALRQCLAGKHNEVDDLDLAMHRTLSAGHIQAVICGALWLLAGVIYPVSISILGIEIGHSGWIDFVASHALAGIAITALTFFATTYLALRIWLPVLIQNSFSQSVVATVTSGLNSLINKIPIYQLLAVSVPLLAMALLVIFGDVVTRSKFPLTVISLFGLLTIPVVLFGGNRIRQICEKLLIVFRS